jgi:multiple sugar transport system substrate-binding protein
MTPPDFDWEDFSPGAIAYDTDTEDRICSIPIKIDLWMLYWNKELFEANGVAYPQTLAEMLEAAAKLHNPDSNVAGFLARGLKNANVPVWTHLMQGWGVDPIASDGTFNTESPEALEAAKLYQSLLKDYSAAGASGFNWNECQSAFALGQAAMWQDGIGFATPMEDETKSKVVGKVGYGVFPKGPVAQHSAMFGDGINVSAFSEAGPAYYCLWATNKTNQLRVLSRAAVPPRSSLADLNRAEGSSMPARVASAWKAPARSYAQACRRSSPLRVRDIFGIADQYDRRC